MTTERLQLVVVSLNHKNAGVEIRDRFALTPEQVDRIEEILVADSGGESEEAVVLATCNRTELYLYTEFADVVHDRILEAFSAVKGGLPSQYEMGWKPHVARHEQAVRHLMRVSAGLESLILGESQILSQVRAAHERMLRSAVKRPVLSRLFQQAVRAGKKVRGSTRLCEGAVSVSQAAVELARRAYSRIERARVLVVGAGETAELTLRHLRSAGVGSIEIANRTLDRAHRLAAEYDGTALGLDALTEALTRCDIVVVATASPVPLITASMAKNAGSARRGGPLVMLDISNPRGIESEARSCRGVFLYTIDHLEGVVSGNLARRREEIPAVTAILKTIGVEYWGWIKSLEVRPMISSLCTRFDEIRIEELSRHRGGLSESEFERLDKFTRSLFNKLLHAPIASLRRMANGERLDRGLLRAMKEIHRLDGEPGPVPSGDRAHDVPVERAAPPSIGSRTIELASATVGAS